MTDDERITVNECGHIHVPRALCEKMGLSPGLLLLALEDEAGGVRLPVVCDGTSGGVRNESRFSTAETTDSLANIDWVKKMREERIATLIWRSGLYNLDQSTDSISD